MTAFLIFIISFVASSIQSVIGFGYIIFAMALFPMFLPVEICLVLAQLGGIFMSLCILWGKFGKIDYKIIAFPAIFSTAGSVLGLLFFRSMSGTVYMKALGVILVLLALWMFKFSARIKIRPTPVNGVIAGTLGGVMGALFGISAPALVLYFSSYMEDKDGYMASLQATLTVQTVACLIGRGALGMWPAGALPLCLPAFAGILLGKFPGHWMYGRLDLSVFKLIVYAFILLFGIYIFLSN